ncbi:MAG: methyltransferase, partial [Planctomycetes bacterium]|nr:methyltransferase [Planctomycetota bacterium]
KLTPIHGGSMIGYVTHKGKKAKTHRYLDACALEDSAKSNDIATYHEFARRVENMKKRDIAYLDKKKKEGKTIFGMGAPVKGNTLLNFFGVGKNHLDCLVEKNTLRKGLISPGMHLPVLIESELNKTPDVYYVLAWNFKKEILANNKHLIDKGVEFYFPVDAEAA